MAASYQQLLDATIQHQERLKRKGVQFVSVSPERLAALASPRAQPTGRAEPALGPGPALRPGASAASSPASQPARDSFDVPVSCSSVAALPNREAKQAAMAEVNARAMVCRKCPHLAASRKNVVFGVGDLNSPLMF